MLIRWFALALVLSGCDDVPCRAQSDCPLGSYCVVDLTAAGRPSGACIMDCIANEDCPAPASNAERALCDNEGRCRFENRPPRIRLIEPEDGVIYPEGTRRIRVSGEVELAADVAQVAVASQHDLGCAGGRRSMVIHNPDPGNFSRVPFVLDDILVEPGFATISVEASAGPARRLTRRRIQVLCEGCPTILFSNPQPNSAVTGLLLPQLSGSLDRPVPRATWRVHGQGAVIDGPLGLNGVRFSLEQLPLFSGLNRIEVVVPDGGREARCSVNVTSGVARERGLRLVLTWDGPRADFDLVLVGPQGQYLDPQTTLSPRSVSPRFGGQVLDDVAGLGPEVLTVPTPPPGVYGVLVEPVADQGDPGANLFLRLLFEGRLLTLGPVGPEYLSSERGEVWIAGTLTVDEGGALFNPLGDKLSVTEPPTTPPELWPLYR